MSQPAKPRRALGAAGVLALALAGMGPSGCGTPHGTGLSGDDESAAGDDAGTGAGIVGEEAGDATMGFRGFGDAASGPVSLGDAGCATATAQAKRQPAYLMFVLDGSDSMRQDNKWAAVVPALKSIFGEMQTAADPGVAAGLIIFPDSSNGPFPTAKDVPVAFVDAAQNTALDTRLGAALSLGTPTDAALTGGYGELESFQPKAPLLTGGKKVVILITDGVPTDDCSTALGLADDSMNTCVLLAAKKLAEVPTEGPIETFVIGVGDFPSTSVTDFDPAFLGNVAHAGGTGPAGCNPNEAASTTDLCYFEIDPSKAQTASELQQSFETALDAIRGQVVSCTFPLQSTGLGTLDPTLVNVEVGGKPILQDAVNGWTYDNPTKPAAIVLNGAACKTAEGNLTATVSIVVGCATQASK